MGSTKKDQSDNNKSVPHETENVSVVTSIKGEGSNAVVKQHDKQMKLLILKVYSVLPLMTDQNLGCPSVVLH